MILLSVSLRAQVITIDVPDAYATAATAINAPGEICGTYQLTPVGAYHAFVRDVTGNITTFDVPGSMMTAATGINDLGQIVGYWTPDLTGNISHLFIRQPSGTITSFDPPNTVINSAAGINDSGEMAINALNEPGPSQTLLRAADGTYTTITVAAGSSVYLSGLNNNGDLTGCSYNAGGLEQSFIEPAAGGPPILFTVPQATTATCARGINDSGTIVGYYTTGYRGGESSHAFVRLSSGAFELRDVANSRATLANGINNAGWIVGYFDDGQGKPHGYIMAPRPADRPVTPSIHR